MVGRKQTGEGKNSIGNIEAKDLICMTPGHELWGVIEGCSERWRGIKGGKWYNRNNIINKIY